MLQNVFDPQTLKIMKAEPLEGFQGKFVTGTYEAISGSLQCVKSMENHSAADLEKGK